MNCLLVKQQLLVVLLRVLFAIPEVLLCLRDICKRSEKPTVDVAKHNAVAFSARSEVQGWHVNANQRSGVNSNERQNCRSRHECAAPRS